MAATPPWECLLFHGVCKLIVWFRDFRERFLSDDMLLGLVRFQKAMDGTRNHLDLRATREEDSLCGEDTPRGPAAPGEGSRSRSPCTVGQSPSARAVPSPPQSGHWAFPAPRMEGQSSWKTHVRGGPLGARVELRKRGITGGRRCLAWVPREQPIASNSSPGSGSPDSHGVGAHGHTCWCTHTCRHHTHMCRHHTHVQTSHMQTTGVHTQAHIYVDT